MFHSACSIPILPHKIFVEDLVDEIEIDSKSLNGIVKLSKYLSNNTIQMDLLRSDIKFCICNHIWNIIKELTVKYY